MSRIDYSCLPQRAHDAELPDRTPLEMQLFRIRLGQLALLQQSCNEDVICALESQLQDYASRAWCFVEFYLHNQRADSPEDQERSEAHAVAQSLEQAVLQALSVVLAGPYHDDADSWKCPTCGQLERKFSDASHDLWVRRHQAACQEESSGKRNPYQGNEHVRLQRIQSIVERLPSGTVRVPVLELLQQRQLSSVDMLSDLDLCVHRLFCDGRARFGELDAAVLRSRPKLVGGLEMDKAVNQCLDKLGEFECLGSEDKAQPEAVARKLELVCTNQGDMSIIAKQLTQIWLWKIDAANFSSLDKVQCRGLSASPGRLTRSGGGASAEMQWCGEGRQSRVAQRVSAHFSQPPSG